MCYGKVRFNPDLPVGQVYEVSEINKGFIVSDSRFQVSKLSNITDAWTSSF